MSRLVLVALLAAATAGLVASPARAPARTQVRESASTTPSRDFATADHELLSAPEVGRVYGLCRPAARRWRLEFRQSGPADDLVFLRIGRGSRRRTDLPPGRALTWTVPAAGGRTSEPADPYLNEPAVSVATTPASHLTIYQGSEPHIFRVAIDLIVKAALGDTDECAPVASALSFRTY